MYRTCIFCHSPLAGNEVVEHFPVGRRLAFDPAKGRLWVVCTKCERWNLTPLEERWEAIEECERVYSGAPRRASTDQIGLARHGEGLELVRVGRPVRPEFAAWRYGDQFGKRRRREIYMVAGGVVAAGGLIIAGPVTGLVASSFALIQVPNFALQAWLAARSKRVITRVQSPDGVIEINSLDIGAMQLSIDESTGSPALVHAYGYYRLGQKSGKDMRISRGNSDRVVLAGDEAVRVLQQVLPAVNRAGASRNQVKEAVAEIEKAGDPRSFIGSVAGDARRASDNGLAKLPRNLRLALEMAVNEDTERAALEGELATLEAAWKEAEEIAAIADDMFLPKSIGEFIRRHRRG